MKSWLLFAPCPAEAEDPLPGLLKTLQARMASQAILRSSARPSHGLNLGVIRAAPPLPELDPETADRITDLRLEALFGHMAGDDFFMRETVRLLVPMALASSDAIRYRQETIKDGMRCTAAVLALYGAAEDAVDAAYEHGITHQPGYAESVPVSVKTDNAAGLLSLLLAKSALLGKLVRESASEFQSDGFRDLIRQMDEGFSASFLEEAGALLSTLSDLTRGGRLVIGASFGSGCKPQDCVLHGILPPDARERGGIPLHHIALARSADEMRDAALTQVLRLVTRLSDELLRFMSRLRFELAFVVGACRLAEKVKDAGLPVCFPIPSDGAERTVFSAQQLVDAVLGLAEHAPPVPNDLAPTTATLFLVTGANQGGKSTFLRGIGLAQVMMQCGLFVTAASYENRVYDAIHTHFAREEDPGMNHGRLEEELARMDRILNRTTPHTMLLLNESFATTTERDGARIATGLLLALHEAGVTLFYVTHLYECAARLYADNPPDTLFLRAERTETGVRPYRILPGEPQATSHARDLYGTIMAPTQGAKPAGHESPVLPDDPDRSRRRYATA